MRMKVIGWMEDDELKLFYPAPKAIREGMDEDTFYDYCIYRVVPIASLDTVVLLDRKDVPSTKSARKNRKKWKLKNNKISVPKATKSNT